MRAVVVLPTYNERENIGNMLAALVTVDHELEVLVVDDCSPDGTGALAERWAARFPRIKVMHRKGERGLGAAYVAGFRKALEDGADVIITMDCDFSHSPQDIPRILERIADADLVMGSRYVLGGRTEGWPLRRKLLSATANQFARRWLSLPTRDCTTGFRAYRAALLRSILDRPLRSSGYCALSELLCRAVHWKGARVAEVPIVFTERELGASKMTMKEATQGLKTLVAVRRLTLQSRPSGLPAAGSIKVPVVH